MDIWSLGIIFYELLHMKTPFENMSIYEIESCLKSK